MRLTRQETRVVGLRLVGGEILAETSLTGTINEEYVYFNGERIARVDRPSGTVHYYFADRLGSASVITDAGGNVQQQYYYFPYGGLVSSIGSDPNHYKFTGKERDSESNLDEFGARYYTSSTGRFMTPDWAARATAVPYAVFGDPQTLNLYTYVENAPVNRADADGHGWRCVLGWGNCGSHATNENAPNGAPGNKPRCQTADCKVSQPAQNHRTDQKKDIKPGDHVFVKVGSGLGLGAHAKWGAVKVEAEVSVKSEGEYTPSGKVHNTVVEEAAVSGQAGVGIEVGYKSEDVRDYDMHQSMTTPSAPPEHIDHPFVEGLGPGGSKASSESFTFEVGGCLAVCFEIGIGVK